MFCDRCGTALQPPVRFCPQCGRQFEIAPPRPAVANRVYRHLRTLAVLWLVYSGFRILPGLFLHNLDRWGFPFVNDGPFMIHDFLHMAGGMLIVTGAIGLVAGWGLLERQGWARILAIILGFINLVHPPLGTALGIYTLWVLLPAASDAEYQQLARE
jgi:hypothetical protein